MSWCGKGPQRINLFQPRSDRFELGEGMIVAVAPAEDACGRKRLEPPEDAVRQCADHSLRFGQLEVRLGDDMVEIRVDPPAELGGQQVLSAENHREDQPLVAESDVQSGQRILLQQQHRVVLERAPGMVDVEVQGQEEQDHAGAPAELGPELGEQISGLKSLLVEKERVVRQVQLYLLA